MSEQKPHTDEAVLRMLAGANFGPDATVVLPSGREVGGDEAQALTSFYAPDATGTGVTGGTEQVPYAWERHGRTVRIRIDPSAPRHVPVYSFSLPVPVEPSRWWRLRWWWGRTWRQWVRRR